jgi:hypothetical protein
MSKPVNSILNVNSTPDTPIKPVVMPRADGEEPWENIEFGKLLREPLDLHSVSRYGKSDKWAGVVSHFGLRRKLEIILYGKDIKLLETALSIQIPDNHEFSEPIEFYAHHYEGKKFVKIGQLNGSEFQTTVQAALPEPVAESATVKPKYHGETVTVLSAVQQTRGSWKVWTLTARADDGFFFHKITAWAEHRNMFTDAGYPKLPERGEPAIQLNADAVIEYVEGKINDYRVTYVYPKSEPAIPVAAPVVIEKPVRHVIAVTIELSLEDQIAAYFASDDYKQPFGYLGMLEIIDKVLNPRDDDDTEKIPVPDTARLSTAA